MDNEALDRLHEHASGYYLKGELGRAREAWEQLLSIDPRDERAREGVRLCDQMAGTEEKSVTTPGRSPFASAVDAPPTAEPGDDPLAELDELAQLDLKLDLGSVGDAGDDLLDLSSLNDELAEPPADEPAMATGGWNLDAGLDEAEAVAPAAAASEPAARREDPAAIELRRRVNELLAHALVLMEQGRKDEALKTLERLLILDDANEAALALQDKLSAEMGHAGPSPASSPAEQLDQTALEGDDLPPLDLAIEPPVATVGSFGTVEPDMPVEDATQPPWDDEQAEQPPWGDEPADDAVIDDGAEASARGDFDVRSSVPSAGTGASGRTWLYGTALIIVLAVAGFWGLSALNDEVPQPPVDLAIQARAAVEAALQPVDVPDGLKRRSENAGEIATAGNSLRDRIAAALTSGRDAMADGDYAAAVVAYNRALELQPNSVEIRRALEAAATRYRASRNVDDKWREVGNEWAVGNYKSALRMLYRLPQEGQVETIRRAQANGWFNLGVSALQFDDCMTASENFDEAAQLAPSDAQVARGVALAASCPGTGHATYQTDLERLTLRAIGD